MLRSASGGGDVPGWSALLAPFPEDGRVLVGGLCMRVGGACSRCKVEKNSVWLNATAVHRPPCGLMM